MPEDPRFRALQFRLDRLLTPYLTTESDARLAMAALAFELSTWITSSPDTFWVTRPLSLCNNADVTDAEADAEDAWMHALDALYRPYLDRRPR